MNYLEEELDETINTLKISSKKLNSEEIATLISTLTKKYFKTEKNVLDPVDFNEKCTEHNPDFWKEIPDRIKKNDLILLVFDTGHRAWKLENAQDLALLISETTGYPFWVTDHDLSFLVHLDDHDCVLWA
ncbi:MULTISPECIES: hypothetical protein [Pseudomonas]|uniref:hypothetical protein n=1 Tax=Pseudomonas TaxID=286 RepID=UPI0014727C92|nr:MULTISPECIES: hypothetical protein [Pseudomonas]MBJ2241877.1 hypothetical protein [Pseudomonas sp. MF6768]MBJ2260878.1 hypothetical protein [Pseudomonas sp. MF6787]MBJ2291999.1 hypothetical protein [Pseudomonas sp. MF5691]MBK3454506.1 hypothetical protein [Pseudomonas sp. MF6754]MBU4629995.1 hypothetical protein [Pseudomonas sp. BF61]